MVAPTHNVTSNEVRQAVHKVTVKGPKAQWRCDLYEDDRAQQRTA